MNSFIKVVKGNAEAFKNLKIKDPNTFYFIADLNDVEGKLYLGSKQITCDIKGINYLKDLLDIDLPQVLTDEQILAYNVSSEKWTAYQIEDLIKSIVDSNGLIIDKNGHLSLIGLESAEVGSSPVKSESGAIIWTKINDKELTQKVQDLNQTIEKLKQQINNLEQRFCVKKFTSKMKLNSEWKDIVIDNNKILTNNILKMPVSNNGTFLIQIELKEFHSIYSGLFSWSAINSETNNEILLQGCGDTIIYLRMITSDNEIKFQICSNQIEETSVLMDIKIQHLI